MVGGATVARALTADKLTTKVNINGVPFDGSTAINVNTVNSLSAGTYLTGGPFNGSSAATFDANIGVAGQATPSTLVARNSAGDIWVATMNGVATSAQYADLAEKYTSDAEYAPGTVVVFGGAAEITQSTDYMDRKVAGVISTNPAHLMNSAAEGLPVALTGRVPCRVTGKINKGDMVVTSTIPGVATASSDPTLGSVIGKALGSWDSNEIGTIEVVVGRL